MDHWKKKAEQRRRRHRRVRRHVSGTADRPRLCVFRSVKNVYCQLYNDIEQCCIGGCSTLSAFVRAELAENVTKVEAARRVGLEIARIAREKGVTKVAFDRAGHKYHGRVKAVAEGAREGGLKF